MYAALNGISPSFVGYITQRKPGTMAELLEAARVAELTIPITKTADNAVSSQISQMKEEVQRLNEKWERVAVNVSQKEDEDKPQRSVSFQRSSTPPPQNNRGGNRFPFRRFPVASQGGNRFGSPRPRTSFLYPRMQQQASFPYYGGPAGPVRQPWTGTNPAARVLAANAEGQAMPIPSIVRRLISSVLIAQSLHILLRFAD